MSPDESSERSFTGAGQSLTKVLERPFLESTLLMMRDPSPVSGEIPDSIPFSSSNAAILPLSSLTLNSASTTQLSPAGPIADKSALEPRARERAPRIMDLPAPVCPVIITRPAGNSISSESIRT